MTMDQTDLVINYDEFDDPIWKTKLENAFLRDVSSKVKLGRNLPVDRGLCLVAADDIAPGKMKSDLEVH